MRKSFLKRVGLMTKSPAFLHYLVIAESKRIFHFYVEYSYKKVFYEGAVFRWHILKAKIDTK